MTVRDWLQLIALVFTVGGTGVASVWTLAKRLDRIERGVRNLRRRVLRLEEHVDTIAESRAKAAA